MKLWPQDTMIDLRCLDCKIPDTYVALAAGYQTTTVGKVGKFTLSFNSGCNIYTPDKGKYPEHREL